MYACVRACVCVLGQRVRGSQCLFLDGHYIVDQAGLGQLPASASQVLGLKDSASNPSTLVYPCYHITIPSKLLVKCVISVC